MSRTEHAAFGAKMASLLCLLAIPLLKLAWGATDAIPWLAGAASAFGIAAAWFNARVRKLKRDDDAKHHEVRDDQHVD